MCSRVLALVLACGLPAVGAARAQVLDAAHLHHKADSLLALWREADALGVVQQTVRAVRHQRSARLTRATALRRGENPVGAGDLMVIADYPDSIPLREATRRAWGVLSSTYGSQASALTAQPIRLAVMFSDRQVVTAGRHVPHRVTVDELERTLLGMTGVPKVDSRFSRWLGNTVHPVLDTVADRAGAYDQLVTAGSTAATSCFKGVLEGCVDVLQIPEDSLFFLTVYDAAQRRGTVAATRSPDMIEPAEHEKYSHCVDDHVDSACIEFLRGIPLGQIPQPVNFEVRNLLVSTALSLGGPGAYDRLMADSTAPVATRLERAANAPLERIVGTWRSNVMGARPVGTGVAAGDAVIAVGWVGLIAFGAIRSTRWRLS
jgi:hypothetical protein